MSSSPSHKMCTQRDRARAAMAVAMAHDHHAPCCLGLALVILGVSILAHIGGWL